MNDIKKYTLENCEVYINRGTNAAHVLVTSIIDNGIEILLNCEDINKQGFNMNIKAISIKEVLSIVSKGTITKTEIIGTQTKIMLHNLVENL
jgi:hypothetical protein